MEELTLTYIKPDAFMYLEEILTLIRKKGFEIVFMSEKPVTLTKEHAEEFYAEHKGRSYFKNLVNHTVFGPIVAAILKKENAIEDFRTFIGATNPVNAAKGTIRGLYGNPRLYAAGTPANAIHGSDGPERVKIEAGILLPDFDFMEEGIDVI